MLIQNEQQSERYQGEELNHENQLMNWLSPQSIHTTTVIEMSEQSSLNLVRYSQVKETLIKSQGARNRDSSLA